MKIVVEMANLSLGHIKHKMSLKQILCDKARKWKPIKRTQELV